MGGGARIQRLTGRTWRQLDQLAGAGHILYTPAQHPGLPPSSQDCDAAGMND